MAYDTVRLRSPSLPESLVKRIEAQCILKSGQHLGTGEVLYELFAGELLGSWDARISVVPKYKEWITGKNGRPDLVDCEPYLMLEGSVHKIFLGHNIYGGPTDFQKACSDFVALVEKLLDTDLPPANLWTVHRVDVAHVYRLPMPAIKEFFEGMRLMSFPRRKKGMMQFPMGFYASGKTTTIKFYHKGSEFKVHDRSRLRNFFQILFAHLHGKNDLDNWKRVERKMAALQRLADRRLRVEVEIHADKFQYDFEKNPLVSEVTDAYLEALFDKEIEKILREGKQGMDSVRDSNSVAGRLTFMYGSLAGMRLHGFWMQLSGDGVEKTRERYTKSVFYRNRKLLEDAGVSWRGTDVVVVANDGILPVDFSPVRTDKRLCFLPARNRDEYQVSRELMSLAA